MNELPNLPLNWKWSVLPELGELSRGRSRHRPRYAPILYENGTIPFVQTGDIKSANRYLTEYSQTYNQVGLAQSRLWPKGTLCITIAANIAETAILGIDACFPDSVVGFIPNNHLCNSHYIFYYLRHVQQNIQQLAHGTVQDNINLDTLQNLPIALPPLPTQRRIAEILGRLDDKIEVNRRINRTLEAMAQSLFKHWFVDFGPFQDGPFVEGELGLIPEGWRVGTFGQIAKNVKSVVDPTSMEVDTPYIGLADMLKGRITLDTWGMAGDSISGKSLMKQGQFLFGKLRPYFRKVGVAPIDGVCSTDILVIEPKQKSFSGLILCHLFDQDFIDYTDSVSDGTRMPRVSWNMMAKYPIIIPPLEVAQRFSQIIDCWIKVIVNNIHENRALATTRDYLLPKLLSGEVGV